MTTLAKSWLVGTSFLAAALRFNALFANRFHADEALFASWARLIAVGRDMLLRGQPVDKPPLQFYLQALFYPMLGPVEWAARLPAFVASLLLVPLVGLLVWRLVGDELAAALSAILVALSPMAIQFSGTAFIDPLLTTLLMVSFYFACSSSPRLSARPVSNRPGHLLSGVFFGLATATKYQAWLFLPLLLGAGLLARWTKQQWRRWLTGLLPILLAILAWEIARSGTLSLWSRQLANYGGIRLIFSWELWPRLAEWLSLWRYVLAHSMLFLVIPLAWLMAREDNGRPVVTWLLLLFLLAYFWFHWMLAIPVWDRYLLPIAPLAAILVGMPLARLSRKILCRLRIGRDKGGPGLAFKPFVVKLLLISVFIILQIPAAVAARNGQFPIGGLPTADHGAAVVAETLFDAPYGTVLYDHWYSWHWRYHLFDKGVYVHWFPHPDALKEDLQVFGHDGNQRYIALPRSDLARPVKRAVEDAGFRLLEMTIPGRPPIALYRILPQDGDS